MNIEDVMPIKISQRKTNTLSCYLYIEFFFKHLEFINIENRFKTVSTGHRVWEMSKIGPKSYKLKKKKRDRERERKHNNS